MRSRGERRAKRQKPCLVVRTPLCLQGRDWPWKREPRPRDVDDRSPSACRPRGLRPVRLRARARPGRAPGSARGRRLRLHEPALAPWLARPRRRALEHVWATHLHLQLETGVQGSLHERRWQHQLACAGRRAKLHRHLLPVLRAPAVAERRGLRGPRGHRRTAALGATRDRRRHSELRAAEDRRRDAPTLSGAALFSADVRAGRRPHRQDVQPAPARHRGRQPTTRPNPRQLQHPRRVRPELPSPAIRARPSSIWPS